MQRVFLFLSVFLFFLLQSPQAQKYCINPEKELYLEMTSIPGKSFLASTTEITQKVYEEVTGENPSLSYRSTPESPVDSVSWYDAVVFCNRLSLLLNLTPVYSVNRSTNPDDWDYEAHSGGAITAGRVIFDSKADGFRLPTEKEWEELSGKKSLSKKELENYAWYSKNSGMTPHPSALKAPNEYGLYDTLGNVWEWVWDNYKGDERYRVYKGGSCTSDEKLCTTSFTGHHYPSRPAMNYSYWWFGIRVVKNAQ